MMWKDLPTPCYVVDEGKIRKNLEILADLEQECGCHILLAQKAFSMYSLYPMIGQYISGTTASGLYEARLGYEEMGKENHVFAPAYKEKDMEELVQICDHIIFNSFAQYEKYKEMCRESAKVRKDKKAVSVGIRINPQCSTQEGHEIYDPCGYASRLGVTEEQFREDLLEGVEGLHFHTLCEQNADDLVTTFQAFEKKFGKYLYRMKWLNMGGGHLMTRKDYDTAHLINLLRGFKQRHPGLEIILEPGSAFAWQTGTLVSTIVDIVENHGIKTAILDVSFACHMPDCLEMPYKPAIRGSVEPAPGTYAYRMGGNSCLSGDYIGDWHFDHELQIGDRIIFEDMIHYTTVKTTMFNGIPHPSIACLKSDGKAEIWREYDYYDYKTRMD